MAAGMTASMLTLLVVTDRAPIAAASVDAAVWELISVEPAACAEPARTRFADCRSFVATWHLEQASESAPIGSLTAAVTISETLEPGTREWSAHYAARFRDMRGVAAAGTTAAVTAECRGECEVVGTTPAAEPVGEGSVIRGEVGFSSAGAAVSTSGQLIGLDLFHPAAAGNGTTSADPNSELGPVRCDDAVQNGLGARGRPGCVMKDFIPTFVINSPEFTAEPAPQHAAFVAAAQEDPRTRGWGKVGAGKPLNREFLGSDAAQRKKRSQVCGPSWPRNPSEPGTPPGLRDSCDEYPFSSTEQGVPEFAVTGHVPQAENSRGGTRLSEFYARYHILDGDQFYVQP